MKAISRALLLLLAATAISSCAFASSAQAGRSQSSSARTFSSDFGFDLIYPAEWSANVLGPVVPADKLGLDQQTLSDPYRRSIACSQNIFSARTGEPRSTFVLGVLTSECLGALPDLAEFGRRTMTNLTRHYELSGVQFGEFAVQGQKFWLLRTHGTSRLNPEQTETIEYLATVLTNGLVFISAHSVTPKAQSSFEHAHLRLPGGVDTELIPAGALDASQVPAENIARLGSASDSGILIPYDKNASHHFDIGAGFIYEVPSDFNILNTQKWEESLQQSGGVAPPTSACTQHRLVAAPEDGSRQVVVSTFPQKCLIVPNIGENLPYFLKNDTQNLQKKYTLRDPQFAAFTAGTHSFAVLWTPAVLNDHAWEGDRYLAIVLTPTPDGLAEFFLRGRTRANLDALMATVLKLDDGVTTALVPANASANPRSLTQFLASVPQPHAPEISESADPSASHSFESGLGFSLELPPDLVIMNVQKYAAMARSLALKEPMTAGEKTAVECSQGLLMAGRKDGSQMITVFFNTQDCLGFLVNAETLSAAGQSGMIKLSRRYVLSSSSTAQTTVGQHPLWAMRAAIVPKDPTDPHRFLAVLLIPTPQGIAECLMFATRQDDLDALVAIPLKFDDGAESTLIPITAFTSREGPQGTPAPK
ncbi:MAG: hypothetical protein ABR923_15050 [Terracidiphilus sp.]